MVYIDRDGRVLEQRPWSIERVLEMFTGIWFVIVTLRHKEHNMDEGALSSSRNVEHNEGEVEEASTSVPPLGNLHSHNVELFDPAMDLDELSLPTAFDILKFYFFLADQIRKANKIFTYKAFTPNVYDKLIEIWSKLNIDLLDKRAVTKNYMHYFTNTRNCLRPDDIWKNLKVSLMQYGQSPIIKNHENIFHRTMQMPTGNKSLQLW
ncbi:uncharacterized protein [Eurosta solidaginis]|uniref:uncharacterized protein isoform X3 n=1 Tax=Eurosta solidaginis TaxID=178769 RepID=UPI0035305D3A